MSDCRKAINTAIDILIRVLLIIEDEKNILKYEYKINNIIS